MISKGALREFLERPLDDFSWVKEEDEAEIDRQLATLDPPPRFVTPLRKVQKVSFFIGSLIPHFIFALDMGAGKTKLCLDLISYRKQRGEVRKALVLVPRTVNVGAWEEEILKHSDLTYALVLGEKEDKYAALYSDADVVVVDYHNIHYLMTHKVKKGWERDEKQLARVQREFDFVAFDEIHLAGGHASKRYSVLRTLSSKAAFRYGFSGTLTDRDPTVLWAEFFLTDRGETLGPTLGLFREALFEEKNDYWSGVVYSLPESNKPLLYRMMKHRSIRYTREELEELPPISYIPIKLEMAKEQREHYFRALDGLVSAGGNVAELDSAFVRLRMISSGYVMWTDEDTGGKYTLRLDQNPKLNMIEAIVDEVPGKLIIFHQYTETGQIICDKLKSMKVKHVWLYGGSKKPLDVIKQFKEDPSVRVLVSNIVSGGTGNNFQEQSNTVVFFEYPSSSRLRLQAIARVYRQGQKNKVLVYDLLLKATIDSRIVDIVNEGRSMMSALQDGRFIKSLFSDSR